MFERAVCVPPWNESSAATARARQLSDWFLVRYRNREKQSISTIFAVEEVDYVIVADKVPMVYHRSAESTPLFFHPGTAHQRVAQMRRGHTDRLIALCGIEAGDTVVDATMGLGSDALVFSYAVGTRGRVIAMESQWIIGRLVEYALRCQAEQFGPATQNVAHLEIQIGDHLQLLSKLPSDSVDVVYFDPMFRRPPDRPSDVDAFRAFANDLKLREEAWREAQRVAKRCVVLRERPASSEFARFGVLPDKPLTRAAYGVWRKDTSK